MRKSKNAMWNCRNPYQGDYKRILCVCSAGLLRSPTIANILIKEGFNCRAVGVHDYALIQLDEILERWADLIIYADEEVREASEASLPIHAESVTLNLPDRFEYMDEELVELATEQLIAAGVIEREEAVID